MVYQTKCCAIKMLPSHFSDFSQLFLKVVLYQLSGKNVLYHLSQSAQKNPFLALNYRGISLLSCVGKLYSSILSNRIVPYSNICNILVDEQNGFHKNRKFAENIRLLS